MSSDPSPQPAARPASVRALIAALLACVALIAAAHRDTLGAAYRGEVVYAHPPDTCDAHLLPDHTPPPRIAEACDLLYSQRMGSDVLLRARVAWAQSDPLRFFTRDLWRMAVEARALNLLDLAVVVPARLLLPVGPSLTVLHLGSVALAAAAGLAFARALRASGPAALAAALVTGTSSYVLESLLRGQYPQALALPAILAVFAGFARTTRGERGGVALIAGGTAIAALLYWQNAVLLLVGSVAWWLGALVAAWRARRRAGPTGQGAPAAARGPTALVVAACVVSAVMIGAVLTLPAALPVLASMRSGRERKLEVIAWGTPYPMDSPRVDRHPEIIDEVPPSVAWSPDAGWALPIWPLVPLAAYGATRRRGAAWLAVMVVGAALMVGPLPVWEGGTGPRIEGFQRIARATNPVYMLVYRWIPTASRMSHPLRYGALGTVGLAALVALGVDATRGRVRTGALALVGVSVVWVTVRGPWPLRASPIPGAAAAEVAEGCAVILVPSLLMPPSADELSRIDGLLFRTRYPFELQSPTYGGPPPAEARRARAALVALARALGRELRPMGGPPGPRGSAASRPTPTAETAETAETGEMPDGACVLYEPVWFAKGAPEMGITTARELRDALEGAFGPPIAHIEADDLLADRMPAGDPGAGGFPPPATPPVAAREATTPDSRRPAGSTEKPDATRVVEVFRASGAAASR